MLLAAEVQRWDLDSWPKDALHARQRAIREPFTVRPLTASVKCDSFNILFYKCRKSSKVSLHCH